VDVISQGRDPKRDFRLPLSRRWRIVAGCAAVLVAAVTLTVIGLRTSHGAGTTGTTGAPGAAAVPPLPAPAPLTEVTYARAPFVFCEPSMRKCVNRIIVINGRGAHFVQPTTPSGHWTQSP
jgi:hypothetical protein